MMCTQLYTRKLITKLQQDKVGQSFRMPCFSRKFVRYARPVGQSWMLQHYRGTLDDCPDSQMSLLLGNITSFWGL